MGRDRTERRRGAGAWIGSALVHGTVLALAWLTTAVDPRPLEFVTYEIQMVRAPERELVVETPDPTPPPLEERQPEPEPEPVVEEPPPVAPPEAEREEPEPEREEPEPEREQPPPEPDPQPRAHESIEASMEGLRRDFPEYYADIQFQIRRCFRWTGGGTNWRATVDFYIDADGSVPGRDIEIFRSSGNLDFDLRAVEAVECAGGRLGPLPDELPYERLPVRFNFTGSGTDPVSAPRPRQDTERT